MKAKQRVNQEVTVRVVNSRQREVSFVLEPWGEVYPLAKGEAVVVVFVGPGPLAPEVDFEDDAITVWGWPGSTANVFKDGHELGAGLFQRTIFPESTESTEGLDLASLNEMVESSLSSTPMPASKVDMLSKSKIELLVKDAHTQSPARRRQGSNSKAK